MGALIPTTLCRVLPGSTVGKAWAGLEMGRELTYEAAAQPRFGDGAIVRVAAQVELLIQVQALELALGSGKVRSGKQTGWK